MIIIILDKFVTVLSDQPQAIFLRRRPISLNTLSNNDVVFGDIIPVLSHSSMLVNNRSERFSR